MTTPSADEVHGYFESLSNWGRWGKDDCLGTLNFVTPEIIVAAARGVQVGRSVSCSWPITNQHQEGDVFGTPQRFMLNHGQGLSDSDRVIPPHRRPGERGFGASEFVGFVFHGLNITHLDALSHIFWDRKMYNGLPAELVTSQLGATRLAVTDVRDGISAMGLWLLDNLDLEALGETAEELVRESFFLSLQPLRLEGATSSPLNPVALF